MSPIGENFIKRKKKGPLRSSVVFSVYIEDVVNFYRA